MNLVALVLIVMSGTPQPTQAHHHPSMRQALDAPLTKVPPVTARRRAWFAHAIDRILEGE